MKLDGESWARRRILLERRNKPLLRCDALQACPLSRMPTWCSRDCSGTSTPREPHHSPSTLSLTIFLHFLRKPFGSSRHSFAASTFAGLSSLGLLNMLMTDSRIVSGVCTGDHLSDADSYPYLSSSGGCNIDMHTSPEGWYTLGCHIGVTNFIFGGICGYSGGNVNLALKKPPSLLVSSQHSFNLHHRVLASIILAVI
jgi:hypothetical protein